MAGIRSAFRARLYRGIHAEAAKARMDHDALHDMAVKNCDVHSMAQLTDDQLLWMYRQLSGGKKLKSRGKLPRQGETRQGADSELVSGEDLVMLDQQFAEAGFSETGKMTFLRRQLKGRDFIRTRGDLIQVMGGIRAMTKRRV
jgi:hypothetical protein